MQSVSAAFTTQTTTKGRRPVAKFEVQWNGTDWVDESAYLVGHSGSVNIAQPGTGELLPLGTTNTCSVTLRNAGYRYSALASGGDSSIRSNLTGAKGFTGISARLSQGFAVSHTAVTLWENASGSLKGTAAGHGLIIGDVIRVQGSRLYDARYTVTAKTTDTFTVAGTFSSDTATGYVQKLEFVRIFTGVIYTASENSANKDITLSLRDEGYKYLQHRKSRGPLANYRVDAWIDYLASTDTDLTTTTDTSAHVIPFVWMDDDPPIQDMQVAAAAAGGNLYIDHSGVLHYEEPWHWLLSPHDSSVWTYSGDDVVNVTPLYNPDELLTEAVVEYAPRYYDQAQVLYTLDHPLHIRPGASLQPEKCRLNQPAYPVFTLKRGEDWEAIAQNGTIISDSVTISLGANGATAELLITNNHTTMTAVIVFLQIRGVPIVGGPSKQESATPSVAPLDYDRVRSVRGNVYMQTRAMAKTQATYLADRYKKQVPVWTLAGAPGCGVPQLELGDRVTFSDSRIVNSTRDGFVIGIDWNFNEAGYAQTARVLDATNLYIHNDYFIIGATAIGSGKAWY